MAQFRAYQGGTGRLNECERVHEKASGKILVWQSKP